MIYYGNPCTDEIRDAMSRGELGCIITPDQGNTTFPEEWDVIADNGCFSGRWTRDRWRRWLFDQPRTIRFAVAPDVFDPRGGPCHEPTLERWERYGPMIERHGFTPAFVAQVGCTPDNLPDTPVVFLGGTTEWKLGPPAWAVATEAQRRGAWVHMGRVNSKKRYDIARSMGCSSVDGTLLTFAPDDCLERLRRWNAAAGTSPMLWEAP